jgi:hypothetical protein
MEKVSGAGETPGEGVGRVKTGAHPWRLIPSRAVAFFFVMEVWVFALYLIGAGAGWPDSGLGFLIRRLTALGWLSFASALAGIAFGIAQALLFKQVFLVRFALVYVVLGAAGLALGISGGVLRTVAAGAGGI